MNQPVPLSLPLPLPLPVPLPQPNRLQSFVDHGVLAGAVTLIASPTAVLECTAVGFSDVSQRVPMRTDDLFWIASESKPMTSSGLMMLVDAGRVQLDDPIAKYLPDFSELQVAVYATDGVTLLRPAKQPILIRHVLSHTSGLPFMSRVERGRIDTMPLREAVLSYALSPLLSEPGSAYSYSNAGINIAGRIIELVSGQPYATYMDEHLFQPLGMVNTTLWPTAEQLARLAKAYRPREDQTGLEEIPLGQFTYPLDRLDRGPSPAGGYFSTAADVARFGQMVLNRGTLDGRRYLSEASVAEMTRKQTGDLPQAHGLGWDLEQPANGFGHGGALRTNLWIDPKLQRVLVYLVQHAGYLGVEGDQIQPTFRRGAAAAFPSE